MDLQNYRARHWNLAHNRRLTVGPKAIIMGVLNVTPDSFSDGGDFVDPDAAVERAHAMLEQGATIIDVGGESTRPGAEEVDGETERNRVLPIIKRLVKETNAIISVDTYREKTARKAIAEGAHIVNDVWGCQREPDIARVAGETQAGLIIMNNGRGRKSSPDVMKDQIAFLKKSLTIAEKSAVGDARIMLDPGIGFYETPDNDLAILNRMDELHTLGFPLMIGTSRKRFLANVTGRSKTDLAVATAATSVVARMKGAAIFRVHDIVENSDALTVVDAMIADALES